MVWKFRRSPRTPALCRDSSSRCLRLDHGDGAAARAELRQGSEHGAVVGAVTARLDEHRALKTDGAFHAFVLCERRLGHGVGALDRERKALERTADVHVAVGGAECIGRPSLLE